MESPNSLRFLHPTLDDHVPFESSLYGTKAAGLRELCRLGLPVPPGFVMTSLAASEYVKNRSHRSHGFMFSVLNTIVSGSAEDAMVAIRSSANASMPGMYRSVLDVSVPKPEHQSAHDLEYRLNPVVDGISEVIASSRSERVVSYMDFFSTSANLVAVVVQRMVRTGHDARSLSGVASTHDPLTGAFDPRCEWIAGRNGSVLASGAGSPWNWQQLVEQHSDVARDLAGALGCVNSSLGPSEIEFAVESGRLFLTQRRPLRPSNAPIPRHDARRDPVVAKVIGVPASDGITTGLVVTRTSSVWSDSLHQQSSLVFACDEASPSDVPYILRSKAVIAGEGGIYSHAAMVCREARIPFVVGCGTSQVMTLLDQKVVVDGNRGTVSIADEITSH